MPEDVREAFRAGPADRRAHAAAVEAVPALRLLERVPGPPSREEAERVGDAPTRLRVAAWNAERGRFPEAGAALLRRAGAEVALLQELDDGMARTGQRHTARAFADALGMGGVFGVEFLELGLGDAREAAACAGQRNARGFHGNALLASVPLERPALVRLETDGAWLAPARGQPRVGGRMALLATLRLRGGPLSLASVHLESHSTPDGRAAQMRTLLAALERYAPGAPALVGGDLNTLSIAQSALADRDALRRAQAADPARWAHPVPHEPLFDVAAEAGFDWRACNARDVATLRLPAAEGAPSRRGPAKLDWVLARGLAASEPEVVAAVDPATGEALSDHEAVCVTVALP